MDRSEPGGDSLPTLKLSSDFEQSRQQLSDMLSEMIPTRRWFRSKARKILSTEIVGWFEVTANDEDDSSIWIIDVNFAEGGPETYALPVTFGYETDLPKSLPISARFARILIDDDDEDDDDDERIPVIAAKEPSESELRSVILYDSLAEPKFCVKLLKAIRNQKVYEPVDEDYSGKLVCSSTLALERIRKELPLNKLPAIIGDADQSNSMVIFGDRLILKIFRKCEPGENPDVEIGHFLTEVVTFAHTPRVVGTIDGIAADGGVYSLAMLQEFVPSQGPAWAYTLAEVDRYFAAVNRQTDALGAILEMPAEASLVTLAGQHSDSQVAELLGPFLQSAELLAQRTGEMHLALASRPDLPDFAPVPIVAADQQSMLAAMQALAARQMKLLADRLPHLPLAIHSAAKELLSRSAELQNSYAVLASQSLGGQLTRIHGDYHLGQVLYTGTDFVIIDFEGEPARSLPERRQKRPPLQDVAGMIRSFHYAASTALFEQLAASKQPAADNLRRAASYWYLQISAAFLRSYFLTVGEADFLPTDRQQMHTLLSVLLLDKAVYELGYELNNRPDWIEVPLHGVLDLLNTIRG